MTISRKNIAEVCEEIIWIYAKSNCSLEKRLGNINKQEHVVQESNKTKSDLQVKHQESFLQDPTTQSNQNLQVENQNLRIKLEKILSEKNKENSRLQIRNQKLKQVNQDLTKNLSEKDEEISRLKNRSQNLLAKNQEG